MPAGKAIAIAAMPTAVLMGFGLTPTLAAAKDNPTGISADDYKACADAVEAQQDAKDGKDTTEATPSPSASESKATDDADKSKDDTSDDKAEPTPSPSASADKGATGSSSSSDSGSKSEDTATPSPSASETKNPLDPLGVGDALKDLFTPKDKESASPTPSPSASASKTTESAGDAVKDTTDKLGDTVKDTTDKAGDAVKGAESEADKATDKAAKALEDASSATPSPSSTELPDDCEAATTKAGANEDTPAQLPNSTWKLQASSLLLKGADYKGLVDVRMADGSTKRVMKYVISNGTDIGDLHQIASGPNGKYFHIRADKGSTSTIRDGKTIMYTEELSGNLLGLIPMTFNADNPPPINLPILYFTNVKVTQAAQFGGTLHVPGLHTTVEDS
ncbi:MULTISPECIES: hypothetical protein [unclassified Streptomyces]|uniref:hypothetical protein n=1 Tax=unclassified Streptomyces TaxID=2593676 RepID=UPI000DC544CE|nr:MULTISPECIES: hypothetical protein [unclassified Streptomyces]RAJ70946.1 hypothetical protein K377_07624 [Streptomyces sp. PsTaAH-137]